MSRWEKQERSKSGGTPQVVSGAHGLGSPANALFSSVDCQLLVQIQGTLKHVDFIYRLG
jgi:hypothetical protein